VHAYRVGRYGEFRWRTILVASLCAIDRENIIQWYGLTVDIDEARRPKIGYGCR